jgi:DNA-binding GntR family transcriptional regulator
MEIKEFSAIVSINSPVTLTDRIYGSILRMVTENPENNRVVTERNLISRFGSSKAPVREALIRLCNEGILKSIPRLGYALLPLNGQDVRNIIQFRLINELGAAREYMCRVTGKDLEPLCTYMAELDMTKTMDVWDIWADNIKYHTMLISLMENDLLVKNLEKSMRTLMRYYAQYYSQEQYRNQFVFDPKHHRLILNHLLEKNYDEFLRMLRQDIMDGERIYRHDWN